MVQPPKLQLEELPPNLIGNRILEWKNINFSSCKQAFMYNSYLNRKLLKRKDLQSKFFF